MVNSRNIDDLHPHVAKLCREFIAACAEHDIDILITSTFRDNEAQKALYAKGRTVAGAKVTNAKPGQSMHNWKCAFDFVPIIHGKAVWDNKLLWRQCGDIAESVGLEWAGNWLKFVEYAHCQYTGSLSLADFQAGKHLA